MNDNSGEKYRYILMIILFVYLMLQELFRWIANNIIIILGFVFLCFVAWLLLGNKNGNNDNNNNPPLPPPSPF